MLTVTFKGDFFLVYTEAVLAVEEIPTRLGAWCERCPCHEGATVGLNNYCARKYLATCFQMQNSSRVFCPLGGKRAAELAGGQIMQVFDEIATASFAQLLVKKVDVSLQAHRFCFIGCALSVRFSRYV